jgi:hypothetical protein
MSPRETISALKAANLDRGDDRASVLRADMTLPVLGIDIGAEGALGEGCAQ